MIDTQDLRSGAVVELVAPVSTRCHLRLGTRGRVVQVLGYWSLFLSYFDGKPHPYLVRATHLRRVVGPPGDAA
jgi:hypothetical protein